MAELSSSIKSYIRGMSEYVRHVYSLNSNCENNYDTGIINHNVFNKFFIIDIIGENNFIVPTLYVKEVLDSFITSGTKKFIKQLYNFNGGSINHRGLTTVLKYMYNNHHDPNECVKHRIKDSYYYSFGNILLDKDFNPLIIPCYEVEILEDRRWTVKRIVYKISNSLYLDRVTGIDVAKKFIISKMIPYLAGLGIIPYCNTGASYIDYQYDLPISIEIESLEKFTCCPTEPSANFQAEANAILNALIEDILNTNA